MIKKVFVILMHYNTMNSGFLSNGSSTSDMQLADMFDTIEDAEFRAAKLIPRYEIIRIAVEV